MNLFAALILFAVPATPTPAPSPAAPPAVESTRRLVLTYGGAAALDLGTTAWGVSKGYGLEGGITQDLGLLSAANVGSVCLLTWGTRELQRHGHRRTARILKWGSVGLRVGLAVRTTVLITTRAQR